MKLLRTLLFLVASGLPVTAAHAGDKQSGAGPSWSAKPAMDGRISKNREALNLAAQVESYLAKALHDYKSGSCKYESMNIVAKDLTDADIDNVAAYYAAIELDVLPP